MKREERGMRGVRQAREEFLACLFALLRNSEQAIRFSLPSHIPSLKLSFLKENI